MGGVCISGFDLAETSVRWPWKLFIFIIYKNFLDQSIQQMFYLFLKTEALVFRYEVNFAEHLRF